MSRQYGQSITLEGEALCNNLQDWLAGQMSEQMPYLLVYADDGVIWGKRQENGTLKLSNELFKGSPSVAVSLRSTTLQQATIFGQGGELRVWRTPAGFAACLLTDAGIELDALPDETYLLWHQGSPLEVQQGEGFALLQEGAQGQRHAPPVIPKDGRRPRLVVRHYVDYDEEEGQAFIALSRLVDLQG